MPKTYPKAPPKGKAPMPMKGMQVKKAK